MKLIIDIPEKIYIDVNENYRGNDVLYSAVKYGASLIFRKYRMKDYVFYNVDWLKERWEKEMELLGVDFSKHDAELLNKIKAEIKQYQADCDLSCPDDSNCRTCNNITFGSIYRIIDKYRGKKQC